MLQSRLLLVLSVCLASLAFATTTPVTIPLVPHHKQRARRRLQDVPIEAGRPVPWHARRNLANYDSSRALQNNKDDEHSLQVAALYQGYGTHYADLWCGTPPQRQTVIVDTGSGVTAFPCTGCNDCGVPTYHIDELFNVDLSSTYRKLPCNECLKGNCGGSQQCQIGMSYQEGSSWNAFEVQDSCYIGGLHQVAVTVEESNGDDDRIKDDMNPFLAPAFAFDLKFGCETKLTGLFKTQLADGIMGMDNANTAYWAQMSDKVPAIDRKFALCFSRSPTAAREGTGAGAMSMGGYDERLHDSEMVYTGISRGQGFYNVHVRKMYLRSGGGESALSSSTDAKVVQLNVGESELNRGNVIVDSGTTDTYYNSAIGREFKNVYRTLAGTDYSHASLELSHDELLALPTILIQLQGVENANQMVAERNGGPVAGLAGDLDPDNPYDVILAIPASHYFEYDESNDKYTNRFYVDEGGGTVLGANSIMGHDIYFDVDGGLIGLAESSCDYEALVQPFIDSGHLVPADNGDSRQSGQATEGDNDFDVGDDAGEEKDDDNEIEIGDDTGDEQEDNFGEDNNEATDDGGVDSEVDPSSTEPSDEGLCDQYPCQSVFFICGLMIVSMVIITLVVRRRRGPRYSEATMSELELRVTSSADSDEVDFQDSYRDMHGREIT